MLISCEKKKQIDKEMYEKFVSKKVQFLNPYQISKYGMVWFGLRNLKKSVQNG